MAGPASKNAKVASKNNPTSRGSQIKMYFQNQEVIPAKFIGSAIGQGVYMAISTPNGDLVTDANGVPYKWDLAQPLKS